MKAFERTSRPSRTRKLGLAGAGAVVVTAGAASTAQADVILSPTAVVSNTLGSSGNAAHDVSHLIDRSGLSAGFTSGVTDYATYLGSNPTHTVPVVTGTSWTSSPGTTTGTIVFDLGDLYTIERLAIWQGGGTKTFNAVAGIDGITLQTSADVAFGSSSGVGSFNVPISNVASGTSPWPVNDFDLTDSVGRYVRLEITSNHGHATLTSFGEIAFEVSSASVPEPSSLALLAAVSVALITRRFRKPF